MDEIRLSDSEWEIMNCLWQDTTGMKISQLVSVLNENRFWDKHTVITLLNRMEKKGAVAYRRNGRAKVYYSSVSKPDIAMQETKTFLNKVYQGSLSMMVNSFLGNKKIKKEELDELYKILEEAKKEESE